MQCDYFTYEREGLQGKIGRIREPQDLKAAMLRSREDWTAAEEFAANVIGAKEAVERSRRPHRRSDLERGLGRARTRGRTRCRGRI